MTMSQWLRSDRAQRAFFYSSWVVVCAGIFMIFMLTPWFQQIETLPNGEIALRVLGGALGILGAPASLFILFGMAFFCAMEDSSKVGTKILWFVLFFTTACFGAAAYFFRVYRKQIQEASLPTAP
jgi:hypothetical protein